MIGFTPVEFVGSSVDVEPAHASSGVMTGVEFRSGKYKIRGAPLSTGADRALRDGVCSIFRDLQAQAPVNRFLEKARADTSARV